MLKVKLFYRAKELKETYNKLVEAGLSDDRVTNMMLFGYMQLHELIIECGLDKEYNLYMQGENSLDELI